MKSAVPVFLALLPGLVAAAEVPGPAAPADFGDLLREAETRNPDVRVAAADVHLDGAALGAYYAEPTPDGDAALVWAARTGGWVLDRVYTAKAFAGLLAMAGDGHWQEGDDVVFWHTGGQPAVFAPGGLPDELG